MMQDCPVLTKEASDISGHDSEQKVIANELLEELFPGECIIQDSECRFQDITDQDETLENLDKLLESSEYDSYFSSSLDDPTNPFVGSFSGNINIQKFDTTDLKPQRLCQVCFKPGVKHISYGARACNSCRAFFQRAVKKETHSKLHCLEKLNCTIDSKSWKSCKRCRFNRCLESGMRIQWVWNKTECKMKAIKRSRNQLKQSQSNFKRELSLTDKFTLDDEILIKGLMTASLDFTYKELIKFYARNPNTFDIVLDATYLCRPLTRDCMKNIELFMSYSMRQFYGDFRDMVDIVTLDQTKLVMKNCPAIIEFTQSCFLDSSPADVKKTNTKLHEKLQELCEENEEYKVIKNRMIEASMNNSLQIHPMSYDQAYSLSWEADETFKKHHMELTNKINAWPRKQKDGACDDMMITLMNMIILFSTDGLQLKNSKAVEQIQMKYFYMLHKYLKIKHISYASKFCQAMEIISMSRELREIKDKYIYCD